MTRRRWLPVVLSLALAAGCGSGEPPPPGGSPGGSATASPGGTAAPSGAATEAPTRVTPADDGRTFSLPTGSTTSLVVDDTAAEDPTVTGDAVQLVQVVNVVDGGVREWEVRAERPGTSTVTSRSPAYTLTFVVE